MRKRIPIFLGIVLVCFAVWLLMTPTRFVRQLYDRLENLGYDLQLRAYVLTKRIPTTPIGIIDIDDNSLKAEGRWPWPRSKLANLVDELQKQGAAVIAFDMFFAEKEQNIAVTLLNEFKKRNLGNPNLINLIETNKLLFDDDDVFGKSIANSPTQLAFSFLPNNQTQNLLPPFLFTLPAKELKQLEIYPAFGYISSIPVLQNSAKGGGFINIFPDNDGIIRRAPLIMEYQGAIYPSLALQTVLAFLGEKITLNTPKYAGTRKLEGIQLGNTIIPTDAKGQVLIPFLGKSYTFPYFSATDVLHGAIPKNALLGKILFIGTSATSSGDLQPTAIDNPFPGVEIHATLASGILLNDFSYKPAWAFGANFFLTVVLGLLAAFFFPYFGPRILGMIIVFFPISLLFINNHIWEQTGLTLSLFTPAALILAIAIINIIYGYLFESRRRERLREMFGQYVPEKHIDEMLKKRGNYGLRGEDREMSVLFADIRNFTTISEDLSAKELVEMLNTFFTPMTEIIFTHHGTIDKYVGDMIMAFWGAPLKDNSHALHAMESGLEMQAKINELRGKMIPEQIKIGIGINSGMMSVGDMGSRYRRNYTVLGDAVNLASRIESLTKHYGVDIIVTEFTQKNQSKFIFRKLDKVRVKGKKIAIEIYELVCLESQLTVELAEELLLYQEALNFYFSQKWEEALALMLKLQQRFPHKKLYHLFVERIHEFQTNPLPADWDGTYTHLHK